MIPTQNFTWTIFRAPEEDVWYAYGARYELAPNFVSPADYICFFKNINLSITLIVNNTNRKVYIFGKRQDDEGMSQHIVWP